MSGIQEKKTSAGAQDVKAFIGTGTKNRNDMKTRISAFEKTMLEQVKVYREDFAEWLLVNVDDALIEMYEQGAARPMLDRCRESIYNAAVETVKNHPVALTLLVKGSIK